MLNADMMGLRKPWSQTGRVHIQSPPLPRESLGLFVPPFTHCKQRTNAHIEGSSRVLNNSKLKWMFLVYVKHSTFPKSSNIILSKTTLGSLFAKWILRYQPQRCDWGELKCGPESHTL